jgi:uncharacterized protein (DUF362 family)
MRIVSSRWCGTSLVAFGLAGWLAAAGCSDDNGSPGGKGGNQAGSGGATGSGGLSGTGGRTGMGGASPSGGVSGSGGTQTPDASISDKYVVAMVQATKANASDLTYDDVADLVSSAVTQAGGLDFIKAGQTVVLKPNLVTAYKDGRRQAADPTVNGITTDWRVVKAVADLVRAKVGDTGKILVMEGSTVPTAKAYSLLGYTKDNIPTVDEFIAIEGSSCTDVSTSGLVQRAGKSGKLYWVNQRYVEADVVISLPVMKTHSGAGITGGVKNLGIGATPVGQYSVPPVDGGMPRMASDCTRGQTAPAIDHSTPETLGEFIRDYYSVRPADFVVMDALQGLERGPLPAWDPPPAPDGGGTSSPDGSASHSYDGGGVLSPDGGGVLSPDGGGSSSLDGGGSYSYDAFKKNMRLILAGRNAVALDTIEALVMKCDPKKVPHLTKLEADGLGTTDTAKITLVGKRVSEVATPFAGKQTDICPGI